MFKLIIYLFVAIGSEIFFYKLIRKIDKKERTKLQVWEDEYIDNEIEKIKKNNLKYKTTKRSKKGNKNDTENIVSTDTDSTNNN